MNTEDFLTQLRHKTKELVKHGGDLRDETSKLVADASSKTYAATEPLRSVVKAVAEGAVEGAKLSLPDPHSTVLKSVVDGVADGLTKSAQALCLTLEESKANGTRFAKEDLGKVTEDFRSLGRMVVEVVTSTSTALDTHVREQLSAVAEHAKLTLQHVWPPLESAIHAAQLDPVKLTHETAQASAGAARQAAGVLFHELGKALQKAGEKLRA